MNQKTSVSISDIQNEIIKKIKLKFPGLTVESYLPLADLYKLAPAILLDLEEFPKGDDVGCGRYPVNARFSLHCILGTEAKNLQLQLREMAVAVSQFVDASGIWFCDGVITKAKDIDAYPGNFKKDVNAGFDSIVVTWNQTCFLGDSPWKEQETRDAVRLAVNPTDEDNKDEYQSLEN